MNSKLSVALAAAGCGLVLSVGIPKAVGDGIAKRLSEPNAANISADTVREKTNVDARGSKNDQ
jgi:hypothetical protein